MTAAARVSAALKRRLHDATDHLAEGEDRRAGVNDWFADVSIATGYEERTIREWLKGNAAPTLQSFLDLDTYWPGFAMEVVGQGPEPLDPVDHIGVIEAELKELRRSLSGKVVEMPGKGRAT